MSLGIFLRSEYDWETNASGVTIRKYKGKGNNVVIPEKIDGKPVISIGEKAFMCFSELMSITLPDRLTSIGDSAFHRCSELTSITIPDGVTSIGVKAFEGCTLKDVWYTGSRAQWESITNDYESPKYDLDKIFGNSTIHFGS